MSTQTYEAPAAERRDTAAAPGQSTVDGAFADDAGLDLLDFALILVSRKRVITLFTLAGGIAGIVAALAMRPLYLATAVILPPQPQQSAATALMGQLGAIASMAGKDLGLKNPADLYVALLKSRTVADNIIDRFGYRSLYQAPTLADTRKQLSNKTKVEAGKDTLVKITFEDPDARRAADVANRYIEELNVLTSNLAIAESSHRRSIFEKELTSERAQLAQAESELQQTQENSGLIHVSGQAEAAIQSVARLRAEIASRVVSLQVLRAGATEQNPEIVRYQTELAGLREELRKAEHGEPGGATTSAISTAAVPAASLRYIRGLREVKYHEMLVELLSSQYEAAKYDETRAAPLVQVVDVAIPAEKPAWPPRTAFVVFGSFFGGLLGVCCGLIGHWMKRMSARPGTGARVAVLRALVFSSNRKR